MGAETLVHATAGEVDVRVVVDRSETVRVGEHLHLVPKPDQTLVFGEDERLIQA